MKLARRKNSDKKKIIYPYIKISDFLKIPQIQEIIDNDNKNFYNFLKEISKIIQFIVKHEHIFRL